MSKQMKREAPDPIDSVTVGAIRFEVPHFAGQAGGTQNGGYVTAHDAPSGEWLWTLRVYETKYDPLIERDVQDVFITKLADHGDGTLDVEDEEGRRYVIDIATRAVQRV